MRSVDTCPSNTCWAHHLATVVFHAHPRSRLAGCSGKEKNPGTCKEKKPLAVASARRSRDGWCARVGNSYSIPRVEISPALYIYIYIYIYIYVYCIIPPPQTIESCTLSLTNQASEPKRVQCLGRNGEAQIHRGH